LLIYVNSEKLFVPAEEFRSDLAVLIQQLDDIVKETMVTNMTRFMVVLAILALNTTAQAQPDSKGSSQAYPSRPVRFVIGFPAGGPTDAAGRIMAQSLSASLGQTVLIDNRPGADGAIGAELAAKATPDGHTLLLGSSQNMAGMPAMRKSLPFDVIADFTPITFVGWNSQLLVVNAGTPAKTLAELITYARANPGKLIVAAANPATVFAMAQVKSAAKVDMLSVPYKGDANALPDLIAGRVNILIGGTNLVLPHVKEGRLRAIAAITRTRTRPAPDVPTMVEAGIPNFSIYGWFALLAPSKTPTAIIERLDREVTAVLKRPETQEQFGKIGFEVGNLPRKELPAFVKDQMNSWAAAAREAGIEPQ
jgi:tripartite-type tricarboxylate transporter receptor subunit TctC